VAVLISEVAARLPRPTPGVTLDHTHVTVPDTSRMPMPRRPNFNYERQQRDRAKAAKRDAKREARAARKSGELGDEVPDTDDEYDGQPRPSVTLPPASAP